MPLPAVSLLCRCPRGGDPSACAASLAKAIVTEAHRVGHSSTALSPFAAAARRSGHRYNGGKLDDATAVVAVVKPEAAAESSAAPAAKL
jgi:hypothetical protein